MKVATFSHAFDCLHVTAFGLKPEHQAGEDRLAIDQNCARPTLAQLAAMLGSGQGQIFTQHFEQRFMRRKGYFGRLAVKRK